MSELRYGVISLEKAFNKDVDFSPLLGVFNDYFEIKDYPASYFELNNGQGATVVSGSYRGSNFLKIKNTPFSLLFSNTRYVSLIYNYNEGKVIGTDTISAATNDSGVNTYYAKYAINDETGDWILSIGSKTDYDNNKRLYQPYCFIIHTTFEDGQKVIFGPDGTMTYYNDDGTWSNSDYKALYNNIGANYSSVITRYISLVDFCVVNVKTGELISIPRFRYATLYNGGYEVEKFEEIGCGDVYALVPGSCKNNVTVCLKEVNWYDVD